ncbi:MAG: GHKL domain-containing protein [Flavisolibacter sp.]|nr:GHKL domain-containing protein [Flavisolibacter sp.]
MRTTSDLDRITPLIWNELIILGVPFIRCGVFIMDEQHHQIQTYLSTPEGKAIATFQLPFHIQGFTQHLLSHWRSGQILTDWMDNTAFLKWADTLVEQGILGSKEQYLTENPPHELALHFIPFLQGMLYVGNVSALNEDEINLVQSLADAFSTAYARYEDFKKLEAAKQQVENTLTELKSTQVQLVQREKMASLGELTAGIAHEIQNPLNFVNNFSEVNTELIFELKRQAISGNIQEVLQIAEDLAENENKIAYHGKRADAIVKGMLQHSHQGMGQKEPTDINALADEYLRLTYHGMRAKDKHFNAVLQTDFDNSIGKVNVVPQDIGRVLLNLFNNAFYAVSEKKKGLIHRFEPMVSVSTKKNRNHIKIRVRDNGIGIPQKTLDKIYQPFFTTKPTGQGTGLGLSLSYDIIKAHGGKLKVDTKEGEYAEFVVQLPL